jgi:purine-binding chemotaxis protein CheW
MTMPNTSTPVLTFRLADQHYALLIQDVVEVAAMVAVTHLPDAPPALLGVANRHGEVLPIVDLRQVFGLPALSITAQTLFIVVEANLPPSDDQSGKKRAGLVVDEIFQVQYIELARAWHAENAGKFVQHVLSADDHLLQILALAPLLQAYLLNENIVLSGPST